MPQKLTGARAPEDAVRRAADAGRYVLTDEVCERPGDVRDRATGSGGGIEAADRDPIATLVDARPLSGLRTASLDEVLCIAGD